MTQKLIEISQTLHNDFHATAETQFNHELTYTMRKLDKPWQVLLIPNDAKNSITIEGYAKNSAQPIIKTKFSLANY